MSRVEEIQTAIKSLAHDEYVELMAWIYKKDWDKWDKEIERDSNSGKLDFLINEAIDAKKDSLLKDI
ncbi:MAG: hypothetical protein ACLFQJ_06275 [Campylobacterales bacterium]